MKTHATKATMACQIFWTGLGPKKRRANRRKRTAADKRRCRRGAHVRHLITATKAVAVTLLSSAIISWAVVRIVMSHNNTLRGIRGPGVVSHGQSLCGITIFG